MSQTITVDGDEVIDATIDGEAVEEITIDGVLAWAAEIGLDGLTVTRQDGSYTANNNDHVVSNGGTITLPSPVQDGIVMITKVETEPELTGTVDGISEPYISGDESVVFVSDGNEWYSVDRNQLGAIPDSAITRTPYNEGSGVTAFDQWDGNNGSINGATWVGSGVSPRSTNSLSFTSEDYVDYGSTDDLKLSLNTQRTLVFWIDEFTATGFTRFAGDFDPQSHGWDVAANPDGNGTLTVTTRDFNGNRERAGGNTTVNDGKEHLIGVAIPSTIDASNFEIYVDGDNDNASVRDSQGGASVNNGGPTYVGRTPNVDEYNGYVDDPRWYNKILSDDEHSKLYSRGSI